MATGNQLRILSLNCWGLKFISKFRKERYEAIANDILEANYDIVNLQEIWVFADFEYMRGRLSADFPHSKFFYSGALGAGLAIFSRFPFVGTSLFPYSLDGEPIDVAAGDWFVGKALASVTILHSMLGKVEIFNTHLFAKGGEHPHRLAGAWELAKLTRRSAELGNYVIVTGDLNGIPSSLALTIIGEHTGLFDSWLISHPQGAGGDDGGTFTAAEAIERFGVTADSPLNSWSAGKSLDDDAKKTLGKRLDYVLYRQPQKPQADAAQLYPALHCKDCKVVLTGLVPGKDYSYSDHFGLEATLEIENIPGTHFTAVEPELSSATIATVIQSLTERYRTARTRSRNEMIIFGSAVVGCVALAVGTAFLPFAWISSIFVVVAVALAWLATTWLYEGFLYGNWECNALMNITEELEIHRTGLAILSGQPPSPT
ncbi:inositol phosphophingolipids phospholipase C [Pluteus cervinus]|uniref:Inositol phosphophingolipids phospholipase C n=1 Tax=Pluteus cervinus TaxID=181527 RepID=A0ACD3BID8_9AGAR|nr:inositol phosphophingolipids phospholipase C [Pluteus cervinus]